MQNKKFRGHIELANGTFVDLVNDDEPIVRETVQAVLKGGCRFETVGTTTEPGVLVYHASWEGGRTPIGWIAPGIAEPMSTKAFLTERLQRAA